MSPMQQGQAVHEVVGIFHAAEDLQAAIDELLTLFQLDPAEFASFVATPPVPLPADEQLTLVAVRDVLVLADGRVSAIVVTRNAKTTFTDLLIFVRAGERWLIDEFRPAPRPPATPIASPVASPAT